jgi:serine/threonine protein kinase/Tol biopolymer transport system component
MRLGVYEITAQIGVGGMGEVYRATDTSLKRAVAIKVLPESVARDAERVARFQREAEVLASLNHSNIAAIYGLERSGGTSALIMELVEGPTLADRIAQGPIPVDDTLPIAKQIAEALEAAHEQGIIHRDLKPANIKVRQDGTVKILDFGLAKAMEPTDTMSPGVSMSPTITTPAMTQVGMILGTAAYMSPEQARGKRVDKRTDIWAFGCVLFEMLTGKRAFDGDEVTDVLAFIITKEPAWDTLPAVTSAPLRKLLRRCLEKDRKRRLADIADARFELEEAPTGPAAADPGAIPHSRPSRGRLLLPWLISAGAIAALVALWPSSRSSLPVATTRLLSDIGTDAALVNDQGAALALSPDGRVLTFVAQPAAGSAQLYVRRLEQLNATPLAGTAGARHPFFSPDGQWIAFFADGKLKKIPVGGGTAVTLCDVPQGGRGGSWSPDGSIIFAPSPRGDSPLRRVAEAGGISAAVTASVKGELVQRYPQVLPGGRAVLYQVTVRPADYETARVVVQPLPTGERRVLRDGGYFPRYLASGHLLYMQEGTLFVQPFDVDRLQVTGDPVPLIEGIQISNERGSAQYAVSDAGTFAYLPDERPQSSSAPLLWMDRSGRTTTMRPTASEWSNPRFSPDGRRLALDITTNGNTDVWIYEWERDQMLRLTNDPAEERRPVWTPDGSRIVFASRRAGDTASELYWQPADGSTRAEPLLEGTVSRVPGSWHQNGKVLAFTEVGPGAPENLMTVTIDGDERTGWKVGTPQPFLAAGGRQFEPMFSPDGRWIAYHTDISGPLEVYVRSFPHSGRQWVVSTTGGQDPVWSRTSQELFYRRRATSAADTGGELYAVSYRVEGQSLVFERPRLVGDIQSGTRSTQRNFDAHPDGQRFAVAPVEPAPSATAQRNVVVVFNFFDQVKRLVRR